MRRTEKDFLASIETMVTPPPDVLLLHEGPSGSTAQQPGNAEVRALLESRAPVLTFCGHGHWDDPVSPLGNGHVVNVDARAVILSPG